MLYFLTPKYSMTFFANRPQPVSYAMIDVAPSSVLRFHSDKIGIMSLVALCSLYLPKII